MPSKRQERRSQRPVNRETFIHPWPEVGLSTMHSPLDPQPSLVIENGKIVLEPRKGQIARAVFLSHCILRHQPLDDRLAEAEQPAEVVPASQAIQIAIQRLLGPEDPARFTPMNDAYREQLQHLTPADALPGANRLVAAFSEYTSSS